LAQGRGEHNWPGNAREIKGFAERLNRAAADGPIELAALAELGLAGPGQQAQAMPVATEAAPGAMPASPEIIHLDGTLEELTGRIIERILEAEGGNVTRAARRLGVDRTTLWRRLRR